MFVADLLKDKVVLITGGGTGLGKLMGQRFGQLGARLAIIGRRENVLHETAEEFAQAGIAVFPFATDIRNPDTLHQAFDAIYAHYGQLDVLVNNAAGNFISPTENLSPRAVDAILNIVLHGSFYASLEAGKRWIAAGHRGTILNIVTTYAWTGSGYVVPSAAAKAGVLAMTRSLAVEWAHYGIRSVAIAPGPFPTEGAWSRLMPTDELAQSVTDRVPLGRVGRYEELTNLAAYLISDQAEYINGEVVTIDGGEWLQGAGMFNHLTRLTPDQWESIRAQMPGKKPTP
ncbi:short-chain dehydrogenase/reductase SDR [Sulfobacillus acidophilus TPY]|uniref:2,4-dienoyl-CoA reductase (NADPH) n=1 Tax=Sulfobacillus acidophilus (strain ATCC 700253 / DSM 10332 / NAL) TaxID=679936 RepID=G8U046_SULAD|nr:short-chain dehydrogenase/reductase SDR [Sulfobacillus acidophilus TPY]AEW05295.1 2,4-dienoyl-CoA reductase (NADPH) [Sulfobacillus acidophilus DSM 10332]